MAANESMNWIDALIVISASLSVAMILWLVLPPIVGTDIAAPIAVVVGIVYVKLLWTLTK
jgi:hypothetical protein